MEVLKYHTEDSDKFYEDLTWSFHEVCMFVVTSGIIIILTTTSFYRCQVDRVCHMMVSKQL